MTPEEAQWLLDKCHQPDADLSYIMDGKDISDAVEALADMTYEYAVQYKTRDGWKYSRPSWENRWQDSEAVQEVRAYRDHPDEETRIVRRLVSEPEVMEE